MNDNPDLATLVWVLLMGLFVSYVAVLSGRPRFMLAAFWFAMTAALLVIAGVNLA